MSKIKRIFFLGDCSTATGGANNHTNWDNIRLGITNPTVPSWMDIVGQRLGIEVYAHGEATGAREIIWQLNNLIKNTELNQSDLIFCAFSPPHRFSPRPWLPPINWGLAKGGIFDNVPQTTQLIKDIWPELPAEHYRSVMRAAETAQHLFFTPEYNQLTMDMTVRSLETFAQRYPCTFVASFSFEYVRELYNNLDYKFDRVKLLSGITNDYWKLDPSTSQRNSADVCNNFTENNVHLYVDYIIKEFERLELI